MKLLELSEKKLHQENEKLHKLIIESYNYDLVIFVARGAYMIGKDLANFNNVDFIEVFATRKGGKIKKIISPILKFIPKAIKEFLRKKEFNSNYHEKNYERKISYNENIWKKYQECKNIILVDDSVDTGYSIKYCKDAIEKFFSNANVKVASLNIFEKSKKIVKTDFYLYEEKMMQGPWSNDSKENKKYIAKYEEWHKGQV